MPEPHPQAQVPGFRSDDAKIPELSPETESKRLPFGSEERKWRKPHRCSDLSVAKVSSEQN